MRKKPQYSRFVLASILAGGTAGALATDRFPAIDALPGGIDPGAKSVKATFDQWDMITDPVTGLEKQTPAAVQETRQNRREHWVQLVPQTDLSASPEMLPTPPISDTIKIVSPPVVEADDPESQSKESNIPRQRDIRSISLDIKAPAGTMPPDATSGLRRDLQPVSGLEPRGWQDDAFFWESPVFCHRPLYFEERHLERDGYVRYPALRPAISGAHFFASYVALPYQAVMHPPLKCVPSDQPSSLQPKPFSSMGYRDAAAAAAQTATVAGLILLVP